MESLIGLITDDVLELDNNKYKLLDVAGRGGSSIVYLARPVDGVSKGHVMIKELFPGGLDIKRKLSGTDAGSLIVPTAHQDRFKRIKKRVAHESVISEFLRNDRVDIPHNEMHIGYQRTNSPWLLEYSEPIEANGTLYSIVDHRFSRHQCCLIYPAFR